ncbi:MAG: enamine deaminase RidA [Rhodospirillaceae bacterium]|nr:enamine deaminase RidA [Rhodospirillaceae bacterium]
MEMKIVNVPGHKQLMDEDGKPLVPISPAVIANGFVYVSGQPPFDYTTGKLVFGDIQVQTRQVLENVKEVLAAAGSSMGKVVKTTVYCTNSGHFSLVNDVYREYFSEDPPARTFVTVASWPMAFDIEIECIAVL